MASYMKLFNATLAVLLQLSTPISYVSITKQIIPVQYTISDDPERGAIWDNDLGAAL